MSDVPTNDTVNTVDAAKTAPAVTPEDASYTRAMGTHAIPVTAADAAGGVARDEAIACLQRSLRRSRIAMAVLGALAIALLAAVVLLASGALDTGSASVPSDTVQGGGASLDGGEDSSTVDAEDANDAGDADDADGTARPGADGAGGAGAGTDDAIDELLTAADIVDIVGENWSSAQQILAALGVDESDLVIITDDGSRVIDPSNWTVTRVADLSGADAVAVYLRHDTDPNPLNWLEGLFS